jgi:hypothetical protein
MNPEVNTAQLCFFHPSGSFYYASPDNKTGTHAMHLVEQRFDKMKHMSGLLAAVKLHSD